LEILHASKIKTDTSEIIFASAEVVFAVAKMKLAVAKMILATAKTIEEVDILKDIESNCPLEITE